jgi:hypothetical protein
MAHGLSAVIDALARRLGGPGSGELEAADEGWLGWDAWVRVSGDLYDLPPR